MMQRILLALPKVRLSLAVLASVVLLEFLPVPEALRGLQNYSPLHNFLEVTSITISGAIFALGLSVYAMRPSQNVWWLAWMFLGVALIDFSHMISFAGMPDFVTPAGAEKAINFWLVARSLAALALFAVAARLLPTRPPQNQWRLPLLVLVLVGGCHLLFLFWPEIVPRTFVPGAGLTPFKITFEYGLFAIYVLTGFIFLTRKDSGALQSSRLNTWYLANSTLIMGLSEYMFTLYGNVTDIYNLFGHVLKVFAYGLLLRGLFVEIVRQPYIELTDLENERAAVLEALPDAIIELEGQGAFRTLLHSTPSFEEIVLPLARGQPLAASLGPEWAELFEKAFAHSAVGRPFTLPKLFVTHTPLGEAKVFVLTVARFLHHQSETSGWLVVFRDVTAQEALRGEAERLSAVLSGAPLAIALVDREWRTVFVNKGYQARFGAQAGAVLALEPVWRDDVEFSLRLGRSHQFERRWTNSFGQRVVEEVYILPLTDAEGMQTGAMVFFEDISERALIEEQLQNVLQFDQLTGLPKQRVLAKRFDEVVGAPGKEKASVTLLRMNLDGFSRINAVYGREEGDRIFQRVTENLRSALPSQVILARDEGHDLAAFVVGMPQKTVAELVNSVLQAVARPVAAGIETIRLSTCIGVARYPEDGKSFDELIDAADAALRAAKEQGPGSWYAFLPSLREKLSRFMALSIHLRHAIKNNEFSLHYQPQMSADGAVCHGAEALIRWNSATLGQVSPEEFIAVAEATGEIKAIGTWVFSEVTRALCRWSAAGHAFPKISINLSAPEFEDPRTVTTLIGIATKAGIAPGKIELELTERILVRNNEAAVSTIRAFREHGFGIALDDFGAGQTSLAYLLHLPVQFLKMDRSLTSGIVDDPRSAAVVRSVVDLAHELGMRVVAEGVETAEQQAKAVSLGCDEIQGFYCARPLDEAAFLEFLGRCRLA